MALNYGDYYVHTVLKGGQNYLIRDSIAETAINEIQGTGEGSIVKAKSDVIGTTEDAGAANTIYGAKAYADSLAGNYDASGAASTAKSEVIGASGDAGEANTVYGAKAYAKDYADGLAGNYDASGSAATAKSEVIGTSGDAGSANTIYGAKAYADSLAGNYDASGSAATAKSQVIGTSSDTGAADTVYGAKAYADTKIGNIGDTDVKSYVDDAIDTLAGEDWSQNAKTVKDIIDELSTTGNAVFVTVVDKIRGDFTWGETGAQTTDIKHYVDGKVADAVTGGTTIANGVLKLG